MEKNLLQKYHGKTKKTYKHMARTVNLILRNDLKSDYSICPQTLNLYANGQVIPPVKDVITAIAKMVKVTPEELMQDLRRYKKEKDGVSK